MFFLSVSHITRELVAHSEPAPSLGFPLIMMAMLTILIVCVLVLGWFFNR